MDRRSFLLANLSAAGAALLPQESAAAAAPASLAPVAGAAAPKDVKVLYRKAIAPEDPSIGWRGFKPGSTVLPAGSTYPPGQLPLPVDIRLDRDVEVTLRDGTKIYVDVYRPMGDEPVPAIMAWSPYGKQGGFLRYDTFRGGWPGGITPAMVSALGKSMWEGPDPAAWVRDGYAVVAVDPRGSFESQGDIQWFSPLEAQDGHDVIEWAAAQTWCNKAVVMAGNSWLAVSQWLIAATHPPHLAAIAPWEGFDDFYRNMGRPGGIPQYGTPENITAHNAGRHLVEDLPAMMREHPFLDDYWKAKIANVESINIPVYTVASWTQALHPKGTLNAFSRLKTEKRWLRVHKSLEWRDLIDSQPDLRKFFDYVAKGKQNGWEQTPRVRLSILDPGHEDIVNRPEGEYPLARTKPATLYLDAAHKSMSKTPVSAPSSADYSGPAETVIFDFTVDRDLELVGPAGAKIWLETVTASDADLFLYLRKADANGKPLLHEDVSGISQGAKGRLRASHRELDAAKSTPLAPVQKHERALPVVSGQPMSMEVGIWPVGMRWHAGERIQLVVSYDTIAEPQGAEPNANSGTFRIRTGGKYDSHLVLPVTSAQGI